MSFNELDELLAADVPSGPSTEPLPLILVVDDDATMRKSLQTVLSSRYRVIVSASAREGVDAVTEEVCAAILDVKMKGYDGFWACNEIRKTHPDLPIIFYSAYQDLKDPYAIINEHRPFGYFTKDGSTSRLLESVDIAVRLYKITLDNKRLVTRLEQEMKQRRNKDRSTG
ncbi:MAG TPA: response regulator transcription factor [Myxococcaceae bacterium]|nr:response regulator transcription factor [Myxococcaceae bacterium]